MILVYVAAPYTAKSEFERKLNVEAARYAGHKIAKEGLFPVMPTVNSAGFDDVGDYDFWIKGTLELMRRCDAVYVVDGYHNSNGVSGEISEAMRLGIPIYFSIETMALQLLSSE